MASFRFAGGTAAHDTVANNIRATLKRPFPLSDSATYLKAPRIVVEILSRSTRAYDLVEKRATYRGLSSLAAYVIVHTDMLRVEVDSRNHDGTWTTEAFDDEAFIDGREILPSEIRGNITERISTLGTDSIAVEA